MNPDQLRDASLLELFALEAQSQAEVLNSGLLALERDPTAAVQLEACMRAAHSLKGAARIVGLDGGVRVAHVMEDCLVAAQRGELLLRPVHIDTLLHGTDLLLRLGCPPGGDLDWADRDGKAEVDALVLRMAALLAGEEVDSDAWATAHALAAATPGSASASAPEAAVTEAIHPTPPDGPAADTAPGAPGATAAPATPATFAPGEAPREPQAQERMLRVSADTLDQLLALSGAAMVETHWLKPFGNALQQTRRMQMRALQALDALQVTLAASAADPAAHAALAEAQRLLGESHQQLSQRVTELEQYDHRTGQLSHELYDRALASRMRPLADGLTGYSRMVRDLGRSLGKAVHLELVGESTKVDRDILEQLEAPLAHLLRNAVDHGIEPPEARRAAGKPVEGRITLNARHNAGRLMIVIADDGAGVDLDALRAAIVQRKLVPEDTVARLSQAELLDFLLLPGFSMRDTVSEVSGRGVGLDAVQDMIRQVRGSIRLTQESGRGMQFHLELPLTLSVVRALLVEVSGEAYAFPLAYVMRAINLERGSIEQLENRQHFRFGGRQVGLVSAAQVLQQAETRRDEDTVPVVVLGDHERTYGVAVDRLLGERILVVQPLVASLGKIKDIAAGSLTEDGTPVLIFDVEDMVRSVERLLSEGKIDRIRRAAEAAPVRRKRVLVVDDSLTVRELERKLLSNRGYDVTVAVDGMDAWNVLRAESFDLVITDIDMPRMDGIELVSRIKREARLMHLPVMVVSYKDREQDRQRGLQAGADYYLAKGSFQDAALLDAVQDLIGEARA
ncbi:hybrid sensor histidine kinase/response regulator [Cupriavidus basilensis]|uniref:hybrid sensor histidine kinase/response regulator n=1 Tax=Cupriavidus basilensis TaxID=68895 RepID=UPI00283F8D7C|nr:hybrid sensor histidine kinase/response regulator [Cupriavidus basilensis]MDR3378828.1 hybrid sensor histidine kinase/response regulator [Cupriavidus basilensis]